MSAGTKSGQHAERPATKEIFVHPTAAIADQSNLDPSVVGDIYPGYLIDTADDSTYILIKVPHDFMELIDLVIAFIARATSANMGFHIEVTYSKDGKAFGTNQSLATNFRMPTTLDDIHELNIKRMIPTSNVAPLEAEHYLAIKVEYTTDPNVTNALVMGARFKYR